MGKLPGFTHHQGKGSQIDLLPHRHALTQLAGGDPLQRTMNNYAKATPSGANALNAPNAVGMSPPGNDGVNE
jgi:hypothetical protein